jgi:lambda family phage tail tape measure protein
MARNIKVTLTMDNADFQRKLNSSNAGLTQFSNTATSATGLLGRFAVAAAGAFSVRELVNYTNTWTDLNSRLRLATGGAAEASAALEQISATARRTYTSLEQTSEIFLRNNQTLKELGFTTNEQLKLTDALNNSLVISGTRGAQAEAVQNALSKAFARGKLDGQNFNTILQSGGRLTQALADGLGVTTLELRKMASDGLLTTGRAFEALTSQQAKLAQEASEMPATIADAFITLRNSLLQSIGALDETGGVSSRLAEALIKLADNIERVVEVITTLKPLLITIGALIGANFVGKVLMGSASLLTMGKGLTEVAKSAGHTGRAVSSLGVLMERNSRGALGSRSNNAVEQLARGFMFFGRSVIGVLVPLASYIAVMGAIGIVLSNVNDKTAQFRDRLNDVRRSLNGLNADQLTATVTQTEEKIADLTASLEGFKLGLASLPQLRSNRAAIQQYETEIARLEQLIDLEHERRNVAKQGLLAIQTAAEAAGAAQAEVNAEAARAVQDVIDALLEQITLLKMTSVEQEIYNQLKAAGAAATDEQRAGIESLVRVLHQEREAIQAAADAESAAQRRREQALERLSDSYVDARASLSAFMITQQEDFESQAKLNRTYGERRFVLEQLMEFDRERAGVMAQLTEAAAEAAAQNVAGAYDQVRAAEELFAAERELLELRAAAQAEYQRSFSEGWQRAYAEFADAATDQSQYAADLFNTFTSGLTDSFTRFVETGKLSFKDLIKNMLLEIVKFQTNRAVMGALGFLGGGGIGSSISSFFGGARQAGGPVSPGMSYLVGERGPEMFVPRSAGNIVPDSGGGVTNVTYNIQAVDARSFRDLVAADPEFIHNVARRGARRYS